MWLAAACCTAAAPAHADPAVVPVARTRIGAPYRWGAAGPDAFDCSGLIVWAYAQIGVTLPHSSQALAAGGQPVPPDQLEPGDVVTFYPNASHAAIYSGDGMVIHASTTGRPVAEVPLAAAGPFHSATRY
jgi:cell wall-associated NlpC family hydrolase